MKDKTIWYLCDGNVPECKKNNCYKRVGKDGCKHTSDVMHATNFLSRERQGEIYIREVRVEDWSEMQNKKIPYLWIIFISMIIAVLTTLSIMSLP